MIKTKTFFYTISLMLFLFSCKKDEGSTCVFCNSPQTVTFEVCEESDGTASVNGEGTGTAYDVYINGLEAAGTTCGN